MSIVKAAARRLRRVYAYLFEIAWIPSSWVGLGLLAGALFGAVSSAVAILTLASWCLWWEI